MTKTSPPAPSDDQLLRCWFNERMDTKQIAERFHYPEYNVESRLWRLRQPLRNEESIREKFKAT